MKHFRRQKAPQSTPEQQQRQKTHLRKLSRDFLHPRSDVSIVMDDESCFSVKHDEMLGNDGHHTADKENTPPEVKFKTKKFPEKLLV